MPEPNFDDFNEEQTNTLRALVNQIIPADEFPSGWDAGVGDYLRVQFRRDLISWVPQYKEGLNSLCAESRARGAADFSSSASDVQINILTDIEHGKTAVEWSIDPKFFFNSAISHVMEGFYADPGNGGNKNRTAWTMVGFEVTV